MSVESQAKSLINGKPNLTGTLPELTAYIQTLVAPASAAAAAAASSASVAQTTSVAAFAQANTASAPTVSFSTYLSSATTNDKTGDGTEFQIPFDTEDWDIGNNLSGGVFTAPVTGKYQFYLQCRVTNLSSLHTVIVLKLATSTGANYFGGQCNPYACRELTSGQNSYTTSMMAHISLTAGDTVTPKVLVSGGSSPKTVGVDGTQPYDTRFSGGQM